MLAHLDKAAGVMIEVSLSTAVTSSEDIQKIRLEKCSALPSPAGYGWIVRVYRRL